MYIFLDESGDLGFDFQNKNPSGFFNITLLVCDTPQTMKTINKAIERTFKNKILPKSRHRKIHEIKGTGVTLNAKTYFLKHATKSNGWNIYTIILNKQAELHKLPKSVNTHRIYNMMANNLMKQVNFSRAKTVNLFIDKSKNRAGIVEFDTMLQVSLDIILPLDVPLNITHMCSQKNRGIQAADLFCWGILKRYEQQETEWYDLFKERITLEQHFTA